MTRSQSKCLSLLGQKGEHGKRNILIQNRPIQVSINLALRTHKLPLSACSLSIDSKRLLKFPAPNPEKLLRWIISMNTVGLSIRGCDFVSVYY